MEIIPRNPLPTDSQAERNVFDKLRESFSNDPNYLALHSLNLTKHKYKKFGEADFVIVCKYGVFVLEVKGGGISHKDGKWYTTNNKGTSPLKESPFRQSETALHAIKKEIVESHKFPGLDLSIGYGVIFPNTIWNHKGSEWDRHTICDLNNFKNLENWLKTFFRYWQSKPYNKHELSQKEISDINQYLRPNFELDEQLHEKILRSEKKAFELTEELYEYIDASIVNNKQMNLLCSGGAGTGKTYLAAELARRYASSDKNIVVVCKSKWLKHHLENLIQNEYVTISTIDSAKIDRRRAGIDNYEILIVDEGQDLFNFESLDILEELLKGGLQSGEWYIFHDVNNQSGLFEEAKKEALDYLEDFKPHNLKLIKNRRNTSIILNKVQDALQFDMGTKGTGLGPDVHEYRACDGDEAEILKNEITNLLKDGVPSESITILSPHSFQNSLVSRLSEHLKSKIIKLDDYSVRSFPPQGISFAEIKNFKGLENEVIIVIDLIDPIGIKKSSDKVLHYVAMSRARGLLSVIWKN
jgi:hypothetical protein